ncbi:MAG: AAA family ATPase [Candidatus Omnitrophota bacterium]
MSYTIAIAGKGGTGKTTIAALLVRLLKEADIGSILAVDADPNSNLAEVLGVEVKQTIGSIVDQVSAAPNKVPSGMPKDRFIEYEVQSAISEAEGFDILTMGKPEGPGCYCYVNNCLRGVMVKLLDTYDYIIIDNEAGLEHLSRRTTRKADCLVVVSDATPVGLRSAKRISDLVSELKIEVANKFLLVNRFNGEFSQEKIGSFGLEYIGCLPQDSLIAKASLSGESLMQLKADSEALKPLRQILSTKIAPRQAGSHAARVE